MGWWSASVLGGDEPLDYLGDLANICEVDCDTEDIENPDISENFRKSLETLYHYPFTDDIVNNKITQMVKYCEKAYCPEIAYQVLGVILMATGSNIPKSLKKTIIESAKKDAKANKKQKDRVMVMNELIQALDLYKNKKPFFIGSEGLFQKMNLKLK